MCLIDLHAHLPIRASRIVHILMSSLRCDSHHSAVGIFLRLCTQQSHAALLQMHAACMRERLTPQSVLQFRGISHVINTLTCLCVCVCVCRNTLSHTGPKNLSRNCIRKCQLTPCSPAHTKHTAQSTCPSPRSFGRFGRHRTHTRVHNAFARNGAPTLSTVTHSKHRTHCHSRVWRVCDGGRRT